MLGRCNCVFALPNFANAVRIGPHPSGRRTEPTRKKEHACPEVRCLFAVATSDRSWRDRGWPAQIPLCANCQTAAARRSHIDGVLQVVRPRRLSSAPRRIAHHGEQDDVSCCDHEYGLVVSWLRSNEIIAFILMELGGICSSCTRA